MFADMAFNSNNFKRYSLTIVFDGSEFCGWQRQENGLSIQEILEKNLSKITEEKIKVTGCSRTDAGVHALEFLAHFDSQTEIPSQKLQSGINSLSPKSMAILSLKEVPISFHARKNVKQKIYRYRIFNRRVRNPFLEKRAWHVPIPLNVKVMQKAAFQIQGKHDFSCFQASDPEPRNPLRTLDFCTVKHDSNLKEIQIEIASRGFLKYMVRNIVGTLVEIGHEKRSIDHIMDLLKSKDRKLAGPTAPPHGLYLARVILEENEASKN